MDITQKKLVSKLFEQKNISSILLFLDIFFLFSLSSSLSSCEDSVFDTKKNIASIQSFANSNLSSTIKVSERYLTEEERMIPFRKYVTPICKNDFFYCGDFDISIWVYDETNNQLKKAVLVNQSCYDIWLQAGVSYPLGNIIRIRAFFASSFKEYDNILSTINFFPKEGTRRREGSTPDFPSYGSHWLQDYKISATSKWIGLVTTKNSFFYRKKWVEIFVDYEYLSKKNPGKDYHSF